VVLNTDFYSYNEELGYWEDFSESDTYLETILKDAMELKVVGIVRPKPDAVATSITGTVGYTKELTEFIIEETKGAFPTWLAPLQVNIIPVNNEYHLEYAEEIYSLLKENNVRVELDDRDEKVGYKMRESVIRKIPITLILGDKEKEENLISYRRHGSDKTYSVNKDMFVELLLNEIKQKRSKDQD
jgi:threonyl-tRNA synthetase